MDVTSELERLLHSRRGGNVVLGVQCSHGKGYAEAGVRPNLSMAAALDRSASMRGQKLDDLKAATRRLVGELGPSDRLVLVAFDGSVEVLAAGPVVDPKSFIEAIDSLESRSGTNISLAIETAGRFLQEDRTGNVKRLLLLTDGEASTGDLTTAGLARRVEELVRKEISTTCLGFGLDYEEDTLSVIAAAGAGRLHHVNDRETLAGIYAAELERLRDLVAPWISVTVTPSEGARVHGSRNAYPMKRIGRGFELELSDLRSDESRWVLFDLEVPSGGPTTNDVKLAEVHVQWKDSKGEVHEKRQDVIAKYADDETVARAERNGAVCEQIALLDLAAAKARALHDADQGLGVEGSLRFGSSLARARELAPSSARVREAVDQSAKLSEMLRDGEIDNETRKKVVVEIHESETPTFRRRLDLGDAPPI